MIDTTLQSLTQKPDLGPVTNERGRVWASFRLILIFHSLCFFSIQTLFYSFLVLILEIIGQFSKKESRSVICACYMENNSLNFPTILQISSQILKYNILFLDFMPYIDKIPFFFTKISFFLSPRLVVYLSLSCSRLMIVCSQVDLPCLALHAKRCLKLPSTLRTHSFLHTQQSSVSAEGQHPPPNFITHTQNKPCSEHCTPQSCSPSKRESVLFHTHALTPFLRKFHQ